MAAGGSGAVKINRMAWQGIVSYRAEPQAVLDVIRPHPMLSYGAACFVTDDGQILPVVLEKVHLIDSMPRGLAIARNNRSSGQGVRGQARWWWHVSSSVVCRARRWLTKTERAKLQLGQLV